MNKKFTRKRALDFAAEIVASGVELTEYEGEFVISCVRITSKKGSITLTEPQDKLRLDILGKMLIHGVAKLIVKETKDD